MAQSQEPQGRCPTVAVFSGLPKRSVEALAAGLAPQGSVMCLTSTTSRGADGPCTMGACAHRCRRCRCCPATYQKGVHACAQGVANTRGGGVSASDEVSDKSSAGELSRLKSRGTSAALTGEGCGSGKGSWERWVMRCRVASTAEALVCRTLYAAAVIEHQAAGRSSLHGHGASPGAACSLSRLSSLRPTWRRHRRWHHRGLRHPLCRLRFRRCRAPGCCCRSRRGAWAGRARCRRARCRRLRLASQL